jgi:hypothetical protein
MLIKPSLRQEQDVEGGDGAEEIRTPDLRRAKAALSQLSYGPKKAFSHQETALSNFAPAMRERQTGCRGRRVMADS